LAFFFLVAAFNRLVISIDTPTPEPPELFSCVFPPEEEGHTLPTKERLGMDVDKKAAERKIIRSKLIFWEGYLKGII
jgi:hypothetical protein